MEPFIIKLKEYNKIEYLLYEIFENYAFKKELFLEYDQDIINNDNFILLFNIIQKLKNKKIELNDIKNDPDIKKIIDKITAAYNSYVTNTALQFGDNINIKSCVNNNNIYSIELEIAANNITKIYNISLDEDKLNMFIDNLKNIIKNN